MRHCMPYHFTCPYCGRHSVITTEGHSIGHHKFNHHNKYGELCVTTHASVCPNKECREYIIDVAVFPAKYVNHQWVRHGDDIIQVRVKPKSTAICFPSYVPQQVREDYEEACAILSDSPKAAATLLRRCLQGMIRDYWKISKKSLFEEVAALQERVDADTWALIDAARKLGNIGAHMEKDINLIISVEPDEAKRLVVLVEGLISAWYVERQKRQEQLSALTAIVDAKNVVRKQKEPPPG